MRLVLASGSPRRASVLRQLGLDFEVMIPDVDETGRLGETPRALAERLARAKARHGAREGALALGFDTLVAHGPDILGKPDSPGEAREMLMRLSAGEHVVFTGIAAASVERIESEVVTTRVRFRRIERWEVDAYVDTGEPMDKAGAYGIQGMGAALVESVEGDFFNVMGFPIQAFQRLLERFELRYEFGSSLGPAIDPVRSVGGD
jgi:septum formation protein